MARSNLAYKQDRQEWGYDAQPVALPRPKLDTIEGQGRGTAAQTQQSPMLRTIAVMCALVIVVLTTSSVARVGISNATVQMMQSINTTQAAIEEARAVGLELEVLHSISNNPTRIQDRAAEMGILPASHPETLYALAGFSSETKTEMQAAAEEAKAAELAMIMEIITPAQGGAMGVTGNTSEPSALKAIVDTPKSDVLALSEAASAESAPEIA